MRFFIAFICLLILTTSSAFAGPFRNRGCSGCSQPQGYTFAPQSFAPQATFGYSYAQPSFGYSYAQPCPCPTGSCVTGCVQGCPCPVNQTPTVTYSYPTPVCTTGKCPNVTSGLTTPECKDGKCYLNAKPSVIPPNAMPLLK